MWGCGGGTGAARGDERGAVAVVMALALTGLVGALAVAVDVGYMRLRQTNLQGMADAAALAAVTEKKAGRTDAAALAAARASADKNGFVAAKGTFTARFSPTSGSYAANAAAVEVAVTETVPRFFSRIWDKSSLAVKARAVGLNVSGAAQTGSGCMMALGTFSIANNVTLNTGTGQGCQMVSQSSATPAVSVGNGSVIKGGIAAVGTIANSGTVSGKVTSGVAAQSDPYASIVKLPKSSAPACNGVAAALPAAILSPGHYCNGWTVGNGRAITLLPGVYYIDGATSFGNNVTITGTGVTLVFGPAATPTFGNNMTMSLTAPTTGATAGVAITQYTDDATAGTMTVGNNSNLYLTGAVYLPTKNFTVSNNGSVHPSALGSQCTQFLAKNVTMTNNVTVTVANNCSGVGVQPFGTESSSWAPGTPVSRVVE